MADEPQTDVQEEVKEETLFNQEQVNSFIKKANQESKAKTLNELGVENIDEIKTKLQDYETIKSEKDTLAKELENYKVKDMKIKKMTDNNLSLEYLEFINGSSEEEVENQIKKLSTLSAKSDNVVNTEMKPQKSDFGTVLMEKLGGK